MGKRFPCDRGDWKTKRQRAPKLCEGMVLLFTEHPRGIFPSRKAEQTTRDGILRAFSEQGWHGVAVRAVSSGGKF
jgi:hypothetical protein